MTTGILQRLLNPSGSVAANWLLISPSMAAQFIMRFALRGAQYSSLELEVKRKDFVQLLSRVSERFW
jgi:hypothetical protein